MPSNAAPPSDEVYGLEPLLFLSSPPIDHPSESGTALESITGEDVRSRCKDGLDKLVVIFLAARLRDASISRNAFPDARRIILCSLAEEREKKSRYLYHRAMLKSDSESLRARAYELKRRKGLMAFRKRVRDQNSRIKASRAARDSSRKSERRNRKTRASSSEVRDGTFQVRCCNEVLTPL